MRCLFLPYFEGKNQTLLSLCEILFCIAFSGRHTATRSERKVDIKYTSLDMEKAFHSRNNFMTAGSANFFCVKYLDCYRYYMVTKFSRIANLVLFDSLNAQELSASLEMVYGQGSEADDSEEVFQQFFKWKNVKMKKLICVRNDTDTALQILADWFSGIVKVR